MKKARNKWTTGICKVNGIDIHYLRTGGDKPSVILLHGLMLHGACWAPLARALETDYDVIMPDARGHGNSSAPDKGYSYDHLSDDVMALIEALGLSTPVLLGHSMGGMTAAVVGSRNPKQLLGLILVDPTFLTPERQKEVYKSDISAQHRQILNQSKEDYLAKSLIRHSHRPRELIEFFVQARFQTSIHAFEILTPPNPNYVQLIKALNIPSLLIMGDKDAVVSPQIAAELAGLNQYLQFVQIAQAGHGVPYDQPELFAAVVKNFLHSIAKCNA